jgi:hypothetical protein
MLGLTSAAVSTVFEVPRALGAHVFTLRLSEKELETARMARVPASTPT